MYFFQPFFELKRVLKKEDNLCFTIISSPKRLASSQKYFCIYTAHSKSYEYEEFKVCCRFQTQEILRFSTKQQNLLYDDVITNILEIFKNPS